MADTPTQHNHYMQMPEWAATKGDHGFEVREVICPTKAYGAISQFIYIKKAHGIGRLAYAPMWRHVFDPTLSTELQHAVAEQTRDCFAVRFEPADVLSQADVKAFQDAGWESNGRHIQYLSTLIVGLDKPLDDVIAAFSKTARQEVRYAEKNGVVCKKVAITDETLTQLKGVIAATKSRKDFYARSGSFLDDYLNRFNKNGHGHLYSAQVDDDILAMAYIVTNGDQAFYKDSGSVLSEMARKSGASTALQWHIMQDLHALGIKSYDMCGALSNGVESPDDPLWSIYSFKRKFTDNLVTYPGIMDFVHKPVAYKLWRRSERFITRAHRKFTGDIWY